MSKSALLKVHEWIAIGVILAIILTLILVSLFSTCRIKEAPQIQRKDSLEILVKGAVNYPGIYKLPSPLNMKDILVLAEPHADADLRRYNVEKPIVKGRIINIPARSFITVFIQGAVKSPDKIRLPKGSRLEDVIGNIVFQENADINALKKKRRLKNNEIIEVATKK